jgi:hypothetical protein
LPDAPKLLKEYANYVILISLAAKTVAIYKDDINNTADKQRRVGGKYE